MYHYHGLPTSFVNNLNKSHIGYAGDGFEILLIKGKMSAWVLKMDLENLVLLES